VVVAEVVLVAGLERSYLKEQPLFERALVVEGVEGRLASLSIRGG